MVEWKEYSKMPIGMHDARAVVQGNKVYIGGGDTAEGPSSELLIYDFTKDSWDRINTPTQWYSLVIYRSQLVLVGGVEPAFNAVMNKLWVLRGGEWDESAIPPMTTERFGSSSVSVGEHLIVAGGDKGGIDGRLDVVEVYDGHEWRTVQSLPQTCSQMKCVINEGLWYLAGGVGQGTKVFYTSLESLTAPQRAESKVVWEFLPDAPIERSTPVIFRMQLMAIGGVTGRLYSSAIHAYSRDTKTWTHMEDLPVSNGFVCTLALPNGQLLMAGGKTRTGISSHAFRTRIQGEHLSKIYNV